MKSIQERVERIFDVARRYNNRFSTVIPEYGNPRLEVCCLEGNKLALIDAFSDEEARWFYDLLYQMQNRHEFKLVPKEHPEVNSSFELI